MAHAHGNWSLNAEGMASAAVVFLAVVLLAMAVNIVVRGDFIRPGDPGQGVKGSVELNTSSPPGL